ncbi:hypothetical protein ABRY23_02925 [Melioribacteraceae bacterium 4301-Me]|uniref:hypothetical protein n=1 Tax=Pyranulibacter aquaticus TaxID=3163344 RepID=UPI003596B6F7
MSSFIIFLEKLAKHFNIEFDYDKMNGEDEYQLAANILNEINIYFYQKKTTLPPPYISEFHKYWEENHEKVLNPKINPNDECLKVAKILENIYSKSTIKVQLDTLDLTKEEIANVRFFTAIQDFNVDIHARSNPFEFFKRHPDCFNPQKVYENDLLIDELLNFLNADSQRDKRKPWMQNSAKLLIDKYNSSAYNINEIHDGNVIEIVQALTAEEKYGFSTKKAHMFLRDMADLGVWNYKSNIDKLDVMSDKNTMRVALRTGIMQFRIPLLASYLDVYCFQYTMVDRLNREAWRKVWEEWGKIPNNHRPPTPASIDYLIYRLGKTACRQNKRYCQPWKPFDKKKLESLIPQDRFIFNENRFCIFNEVCQLERKLLNAPNSISIEGKTGWKKGRTNKGGGGGISS